LIAILQAKVVEESISCRARPTFDELRARDTTLIGHQNHGTRNGAVKP